LMKHGPPGELAGVSRRTVFLHFPSKDAMLLDHFVVHREVLLRRLLERPRSEPVLVSLHLVLREMCDEGYDRRLLAQIRAVLSADPEFFSDRLWGGVQAFQQTLVEALKRRLAEQESPMEISAMVRMALGWFITATHYYLIEDQTLTRRVLRRSGCDLRAIRSAPPDVIGTGRRRVGTF
jgi:AcrR family transcriptional regulator